MIKKEVIEKIENYRSLIGKTIGQDTIAAILPIPIDSKMTVEQTISMMLSVRPLNMDDFTEFRAVVLLNIDEFNNRGVVIWKDLDEVLTIFGAADGI